MEVLGVRNNNMLYRNKDYVEIGSILLLYHWEQLNSVKFEDNRFIDSILT